MLTQFRFEGFDGFLQLLALSIVHCCSRIGVYRRGDPRTWVRGCRCLDLGCTVGVGERGYALFEGLEKCTKGFGCDVI